MLPNKYHQNLKGYKKLTLYQKSKPPLDISSGSSAELGYIKDNNFGIIQNLHEEVNKLLYSFQKSLKGGLTGK